MHVNGHLIWANGPFPAGRFSYLKIFKHKLIRLILNKESVIGDGGYIHQRCVTPHSVRDHDLDILSRISASNENVNERLKNFNTIQNIFSHSVSLPGYVFHAIIQLKEILMDTTDPLSTIYYINIATYCTLCLDS